MATQHKRFGWHWSSEERDTRKKIIWGTIRRLNTLQEQLRRIQQLLPQFAEIASAALEPALELLKQLKLLDIRNNGRKYQPLSPEEVDEWIREVPQKLELWIELQQSPHFIKAVQERNRETRQRNAEIREHHRAIVKASEAHFQTLQAILARARQGDIIGALNQAAEEGFLS